jgi:hypothetical protein
MCQVIYSTCYAKGLHRSWLPNYGIDMEWSGSNSTSVVNAYRVVVNVGDLEKRESETRVIMSVCEMP